MTAQREERQEGRDPVCCESCGEDLVPHFLKVRDPITNEAFGVARCTRCGLGHTVPRPADLGRYYAADYYGGRHGFTLAWAVRRRRKLVASALPGDPGRRLLDVGCGDGAFLLASRRAGWRVFGTERHPEPARASGLDVEEGMERIRSSGPFDCVTLWHVLEHIPDLRRTLGMIGDALAPEGRVVIAVPDWGGLQSLIFRERWLHLDVPRHLYHFDAKSLRSLLESAGFSTERRWHQEFEYDLLGWSQSALNYLMRSPNVFFDCLTGKHGRYGVATRLAALAFGSTLTALSVPAVAIGTLARRGGTLIVSARRSR